MTNLSSEIPNVLPCFSATPMTVYGMPADADGVSDRVDGREEVLLDVLSDDDHQGAGLELLGRERASADHASCLIAK